MAAAARRSSGAQAEASHGASFSGDGEASAGSSAQQLQHWHSMGQLPSLGRSQQQQGAGTFARATRIGALGVNKLLRMCKPFLEGCGLPVSASLNICKPSWESGKLPLSASALHAMLGRGRSGKTSAAATSPSNVPTS